MRDGVYYVLKNYTRVKDGKRNSIYYNLEDCINDRYLVYNTEPLMKNKSYLSIPLELM